MPESLDGDGLVNCCCFLWAQAYAEEQESVVVHMVGSLSFLCSYEADHQPLILEASASAAGFLSIICRLITETNLLPLA
jgi:hypothetical protein